MHTRAFPPAYWAWGSRPGGEAGTAPQNGERARTKALPAGTAGPRRGTRPAQGVECAAWAAPPPSGAGGSGAASGGLCPTAPRLWGRTVPSAAPRTPRHLTGMATFPPRAWPSQLCVCGEEGQGHGRGWGWGRGPPGAWLTLLARGPRVAVHAVALPGDGVTVSTHRTATAQGTARPEEALHAACRAGAAGKARVSSPSAPARGPRPPSPPHMGSCGSKTLKPQFPWPCELSQEQVSGPGTCPEGDVVARAARGHSTAHLHVPTAQEGLLPA